MGVVPVEEAQASARERGLDLVEVAPNARPPVCRIMDYGRYKYEQAKADREARKKQHVTQMKEIKMRPNIEEHDFEFKTRHIRRFLEERNKVKVTIMFRGREMAHTENGKEVLDDVIEEIGDLALQVVFLAELGRRERSFGPDDSTSVLRVYESMLGRKVKS